MKSIFKKFVLASLVAFVALTFFSCSADDEFAPVSVNTRTPTSVSGVITGANYWSGTVHLDGKVFLVNGTLNIAAGTQIIGNAKSTPEEASALIITKTGTISAIGSASSPIVFKGESATKGSWGGLVLLGTGAINQSTAQTIEGITSAQAGGNDITYGTPANGLSQSDINTINDVSPDTLSYVRVEFAGAKITEGNELNSFTFGGIGSRAQLDHLQAYYGADDAFEFFGGAANAKYLIAVGADDDSFDFDFGYTGKLQFLVSVLDPAVSYSGNANGIESDNNAAGDSVKPYTRPVISNLTIVGTSDGDNGSATGTIKFGTHFRRTTRFVLRNSIVYGFDYSPSVIYLDNTEGVGVTQGVSKLNDLANTLVNDSSYFAHNVVGLISGATAYNSGWTPDTCNRDVAWNAMTLRYPFTYSRFFSSSFEGLRPTGTPASTGADFTGLNDGWFDTTPTYKGGVSDSNYWIADSWVNRTFPL